MKRCTAALLLVAMTILGAVPAMAQEEEATEDLAALAAEMADLLDQALYLAVAALTTSDRADQALYTQGIINLLNGPRSPDFDASEGAAVPSGEGLRDLMLDFRVARTADAGTDPAPVPASYAVQVFQVEVHTETYLYMAADAAVAALERVISLGRGLHELRQAYAYLLAARGKTSDELLLGGIQTLVKAFPTLDIWVGPDESIQAAIDRAPTGSTIHLEPGVYRERIIIDKDITLAGAGASDEGVPMPTAGIVGVAWDAVVVVEGDGVEARLENLTLHGGAAGLLISGENAAILDYVWIGMVQTGISASEGATVTCNVCVFQDIETALTLHYNATALVTSSAIRDCSHTAVSVLFGAGLTMIDSRIESGESSGIYLQDDATLHLERCKILGNKEYGVYAHSPECEDYTSLPSRNEEYDFRGTITGASNTIPGPDEEYGNLEGDVCPAEYLFLKEDGPTTLPPGSEE